MWKRVTNRERNTGTDEVKHKLKQFISMKRRLYASRTACRGDTEISLATQFESSCGTLWPIPDCRRCFWGTFTTEISRLYVFAIHINVVNSLSSQMWCIYVSGNIFNAISVLYIRSVCASGVCYRPASRSRHKHEADCNFIALKFTNREFICSISSDGQATAIHWCEWVLCACII